MIPIAFEYRGRVYISSLCPVHGAAGNTWHLMHDNYYCGRLRLDANGIWRFDAARDKQFVELTEYFADYVIAWYQ